MLNISVPPTVERIEGVPLLYLGEDIQLKCHVTGIPAPKIEWYFNRGLVTPSQDGRISIPEPSRLTVKFVTEDDEGIICILN